MEAWQLLLLLEGKLNEVTGLWIEQVVETVAAAALDGTVYGE